jgi:hypothetical protein
VVKAGSRSALAVVRNLRAAADPDELDAFETDVLSGFVLARAAAGLSDGTISSDVIHVDQVRAWFGRPLWDMEPPDADEYFGMVLRSTARGTRLCRAKALKKYFLFLDLRHQAEIHRMTGCDLGIRTLLITDLNATGSACSQSGSYQRFGSKTLTAWSTGSLATCPATRCSRTDRWMNRRRVVPVSTSGGPSGVAM